MQAVSVWSERHPYEPGLITASITSSVSVRHRESRDMGKSEFDDYSCQLLALFLVATVHEIDRAGTSVSRTFRQLYWGLIRQADIVSLVGLIGLPGCSISWTVDCLVGYPQLSSLALIYPCTTLPILSSSSIPSHSLICIFVKYKNKNYFV